MVAPYLPGTGQGIPECILHHESNCKWQSTCQDNWVYTLDMDDANYPDMVILTIDMLGDGVVRYWKRKSEWGCNCNNEMQMLCPTAAIGRSGLPCRMCLTPVKTLSISCCTGQLPDQLAVEVTQLNNSASLQTIDGQVLTLDFVANHPGGGAFSSAWDGFLVATDACKTDPYTVAAPSGCTRTNEIKKLLVGMACFQSPCGSFCGELYGIYGFEYEQVTTCPSGVTTATLRVFDYIYTSINPPNPPAAGDYAKLSCSTLTASGKSHLWASGVLSSFLGDITDVPNNGQPCYDGVGAAPDGYFQFQLDFTS